MAMEHEVALWLHAERLISIVELAEYSGLPASLLQELVEYGALTPTGNQVEWVFGGDCVARLRTAARLRDALELDTAALALALSFLERIERLEGEVTNLSARLPRGGPD
ncbi:MAG: chaperone modulator CbpM [Pseudomonadota bacterium]|nr:chaperone modulator CbpM [Pseudomonadota bacterium]